MALGHSTRATSLALYTGALGTGYADANMGTPWAPVGHAMGRCLMVKWLLDPKLFNYLIMILYALNVARWSYQRSLADACYWGSALLITATVTFLYKH